MSSWMLYPTVFVAGMLVGGMVTLAFLENAGHEERNPRDEED